MAEKQANNKESRHQSAKNKYHHYQRVLSCKNLMKTANPLIPSPGQFVITNTKTSQLSKNNQSKSCAIILTKNIKNILQTPNSAPFNEIISQVVNVKSKESVNLRMTIKKQNPRDTTLKSDEIQKYFKRPISAKIYKQTEGRDIQSSLILKNAIAEQRKIRKQKQIQNKNYFQVRSKLKIPKHIQGHQIINLQQKNKGISNNQEHHSNKLLQKQEKMNQVFQVCDRNFLPTQYYLNEVQKPQQLIKKFKNQQGIIFGFSKWFHNDGTTSWKKCRILGYLLDQQRWEIEWLGSGIRKKVARNNLFFQHQNFEQFNKIVKKAQNLRKNSQVYMKYNMLINLITTPTPQISQKSQQRINQLIYALQLKSKQKNQILNSQTKKKLLEDVKKLYVRACHQFQFNSMLPYNENYKKMFEGVLPDTLFQVNPRKTNFKDSFKIETLSNSKGAEIFENGLKKLKQKGFMNSQKKIKILELINIMKEELSNIDLLKDYRALQQKQYTVQQLNLLINRNITEYFYKISCRFCDIEHHVSKDLDLHYANKKSATEQFYNQTMGKYHKFLVLVNLKLEECLRQSLTMILTRFANYLPSLKNQTYPNTKIDFNVQNIFWDRKVQFKLKTTINIKQGKIQINPGQTQFTKVIQNCIIRITQEMKTFKTISKSYLPQIRPNNIMKIIDSTILTQQMQSFYESFESLKQNTHKIQINFQKYVQSLNIHIQQIFSISNEIQKKIQKKNSYAEIQEIIDKINKSQSQFNKLIKINQFNLCGLYFVNLLEVRTKYCVKKFQIMKEVSTILMQKIFKDNQKMDKNIEVILENMQKVPMTISEYVELQNYVTGVVKDQIQKTHHKAKLLTEKMNVLQKTGQIIQYNQFQTCCQIYLKPLKLKKVRQQTLYKLQNIYKKNFTQELTKDSYNILDNIKNCEKMFSESLQYRSLEQMNKNFETFSKLNSELQNSYQKMVSINQKQQLLKFTITNFDRLLEVKSQFEPYYKLITAHKYYKLNLAPLMQEAFSQINYQLIHNNVNSTIQTLTNLRRQRFIADQTYEPIVQNILYQYSQFNSHLSLIKTLRNPDLRDRHWVIIEQITRVDNIRSQNITLKQILNESIKSQQAELQKVSQIATKELIYEKSLNQLKKQWKDVRIITKQIKIGNELFKFIRNSHQIEKKIQEDLIQVNRILSSSFIKFLEIDVMQWKSTVLQKIYEFIIYWPAFQTKIIHYLKLFSILKVGDVFSNWENTQKNFQKHWKQIMTNIQLQSLVIDVANSRTWQNINSLQNQMDEIQTILCSFIERKKKINAKLRIFSDDSLISMMMQSNLQTTFKNLQRCFTGAKSLRKIQVPSNGQTKIEIMSKLDQPIIINLQQLYNNEQKNSQKFIESNQNSLVRAYNNYQFDSLLLAIDKQLKKQIKKTFFFSLDHDTNEEELLGQVQLLRARLVFKNNVEEEMEVKQTLDGLQIQITSDLRQIANKTRNEKNKKKIKIFALHIMELINQLNTIRNLNKNHSSLNSFDWFKEPKYFLIQGPNIQNQKLKLVVGEYSREYMFELTECQKYVANPLSDATFLNICSALNDRMIVVLQGGEWSGRSMHLNYLGELMGRNCTNVVCSALTSASHLFQYIKVAASGLFLILEQFHKLTSQCISVFNQSLVTFWINYQLSKASITTFKLNNEEIILDVNNFAFFCLSNNKNNLSSIASTKQCFRTLNIVSFQPKCLLQCALFAYGLTQADKIDLSFIPAIFLQLQYHCRLGNMVHMSICNFIWQIASKFHEISIYIQEQSNETSNDIKETQQQKYNIISIQTQLLYEAVENVLCMYLPYNSQRDSEIWKNIYKLKLLPNRKVLPFTKINMQGAENDTKDIHSTATNHIQTQGNQYDDQKQLKAIQDILDYHCGVVIAGPINSGKSSIISGLAQNKQCKKYNITGINPLAYTVEELYQGNQEGEGIIQQMILQIKLKANVIEPSEQVVNGLHFDSSIGPWAEPLISIVDQPDLPRISTSNGSQLVLPSHIKLIFEVQTLQSMAPNCFHSLGIVILNDEIKWKKMFGGLIRKYFKSEFYDQKLENFTKQIFEQSFDSVLQFYQSIMNQKSFKTDCKTKVPTFGKTVILDFVMKFMGMICVRQINQKMFQTQTQCQKQQKQNEQKIKSQIFIIYMYSVISTVGLLIPQQSRKTFSRHFKYVLQQTFLSKYATEKNSILLNQNDSLYQFYYEDGQCKKFKYDNNALRNDKILLFNKYLLLSKTLTNRMQNGISCFIIGEQCSSKNFVYKYVIQNLQNQKFTKNYFTFSSLTSKFGITGKLQELIQSQKYSKKLQGLSNCKNNLIYVQDLNMVMLNQEPSKNGSVVEALREFYRKKSMYINNIRYGFFNLQFYGTLHQNLPMPKNILKYINPILMSNPQNRVQSILHYYISSTPINSFEMQLVIKCTQNLHQVIKRDLVQAQGNSLFKHKFYLTDMIRVVKGVSKIIEGLPDNKHITVNQILRYWAYMVSKVYQSKINSSNRSVLFYLVNNVLMEQHRVRYKTICPSSDFYIVGLSNFEVLKTSSYIKPSYQIYTINTLRQKLLNMSMKVQSKFKHFSMFINQNSQQIIKLIAKFLNGFDFQSKIIILFNLQKRRIQPILQIVSLANNSMYFETENCTISQQMPKIQEYRQQKIITYKFTKQYFNYFGKTVSKSYNHFNSLHQTSKKLQVLNEQKKMLKQKTEKAMQKNKIVMHLKDEESLQNNIKNSSNFVLQDLLSYIKLNQHPKWAVPREEIYDEMELTETSIGKKSVLSKALINKECQQQTKQIQQLEELCKNMQIYVVLHYFKISPYLLQYYSNLVDESSIIFLNGFQIEPAQNNRSTKIIVTQVKQDQDFEDQYSLHGQLTSYSPQEIKKYVNIFGSRVYIDLTYQIFNQFLMVKQINKRVSNCLAHKYSFSDIFNKFQNQKKQIYQNKLNIEKHLKNIVQISTQIKHKLQLKNKQQNLLLDRYQILLLQIKSKIEKQKQKYESQKKKISQITDKISKKQKQHEQNLKFYRQRMDKYSFQFGKVKQKLIKVFTNYESGKFIISNVITNENKLMIESLSCILCLINLQKNEEVGGAAVRQFAKAVKDKKLCKLLQKLTIQELPNKAISKVDKILQTYKFKNIQNPATKKNYQQQNQQLLIFKTSLYQFLQICNISKKQFNSQKCKQSYEIFQSAAKQLQKSRTEFAKKDKSKAIKELFENFEKMCIQRQQIWQKITNHKRAIVEIQEALINLTTLTKDIIPELTQIYKSQVQNQVKIENNTVVSSLCVRFFNQLHCLPFNLFQQLFVRLKQRLCELGIEQEKLYKNIKVHDRTTIDSVYNYKGFLLVQVKCKQLACEQSRSVIADLFYKGKKCKYLNLAQLKQISQQQLVMYDAAIVSLWYLSEKESKQKVQQILSMQLPQSWSIPLIIESSYFTDEQINNYPYINFVNPIGNSVRLPYDYVNDKVMQQIHPMAQNYHTKQHAEHTNTLCRDSHELLHNFLSIQLQKTINLTNINHYISQINQLLTAYRNKHKSTTTNQQIGTNHIIQYQKQKQVSMSDKQKQKIFIDQKIGEFFSKYYIVCQSVMRQNEGICLPLQTYLQIVSKISRLASTASQASATTIDNLIPKYLNMFKCHYPQLVPKMPTYLLMLFLKSKISNFGNGNNFSSYVRMAIQQIYSPLSIGQSRTQEQIHESVRIMVNKFQANVKGFQTLCDDIVNDFDLWEDDINNLYKQMSDPPLEWIYFMANSNREKFNSFISSMEEKLIQNNKQPMDQNFSQTLTVKQKLNNLFTTDLGNKNLNGNSHLPSPLTLIFLQYAYGYHHVVQMIQDEKLQYQFVNIKLLLENEQLLQTSQKQRKSLKNMQSQFLGSSKIGLAFIKNYSELVELSRFVEHYQNRFQQRKNKLTQSDQISSTKLIIFSNLRNCEAIKNSIVIFEEEQNKVNSLRSTINATNKFYTNYMKDKIKCKQYDHMPIKLKRNILQIQLATLKNLIDLPLDADSDPFLITQRSFKIINKLIKSQKTNKSNIQNQSNQDIQQWRFSLMQIFNQAAYDQCESIKINFRIAQNQAKILLDQQTIVQTKISCLVSSSKIGQMASKVEAKAKIRQRINKISNLKQLRKQRTQPFSLKNVYLQAHKQNIEISKQNKTIKMNTDGIKISELMYLKCRKFALSCFFPVSASICKLQLCEKVEDNNYIADSNICITVRQSFSDSIQQAKHKHRYIINLIPVLKGKSSQTKNQISNMKGKLINHPEFKVHQLYYSQKSAQQLKSKENFPLLADYIEQMISQ